MTKTMTKDDIIEILNRFYHPKHEKTLLELNFKQDIQVYEASNTLRCIFECPQKEARHIHGLEKRLKVFLKEKTPFKEIQVLITAHQPLKEPSLTIQKEQPKLYEKFSLPQIKKIIAVASGKGGVGKSTIAVNLAASLAEAGYKTGLLDADIYGPSTPMMTGTMGKPEINNKTKKLIPHQKYGLHLMSIGYMVDETMAMIWRGPMVQTAIRQMLLDVEWPALDVLIIDLPPGTGDAQLTMAQKVPLSGAIIVSTPQDIALLDAKRGIEMFRKTHVPILGLVENMSYFECPNCGHHSHIFNNDGAVSTAKKMNIPLLGQLPLEMRIREKSDKGEPFVLDKETRDLFAPISLLVQNQLQNLKEVKRA